VSSPRRAWRRKNFGCTGDRAAESMLSTPEPFDVPHRAERENKQVADGNLRSASTAAHAFVYINVYTFSNNCDGRPLNGKCRML